MAAHTGEEGELCLSSILKHLLQRVGEALDQGRTGCRGPRGRGNGTQSEGGLCQGLDCGKRAASLFYHQHQPSSQRRPRGAGRRQQQRGCWAPVGQMTRAELCGGGEERSRGLAVASIVGF